MSATGGILTPSDTATQLDGSGFVHLDGVLHASFTTSDFASALHLVDLVGEAAESMNHHPDIRLGYGTVAFALNSHDVGGVTARDVRLALRIQELADSLGAVSAGAPPARYEIAIDCTDSEAIRPFWRVGLGYEESVIDDEIVLVDPRGLGPRVWFQHLEIERTDRNRIHLDVYVPTNDAKSRTRAVIDAGGTLLTDEHAPDWWVLADVEGNELCVCTSAN